MSTGVLGINARNLLYIHPYNTKKAVRLADDKLKTKHFLSARGIPVPRVFGQIRSHTELERFNFDILPDSFVIKPNLGYGGEGIIPVVERRGAVFLNSTGAQLQLLDIKDHIRDILDGRFALTQRNDSAFFEQLIVPDESVGKYSYRGLPDIRVVVYNLIPVMAMLRLPTKRSSGRANLHQGAIGVGIDIARGEATYIAQGGNILDEVPGVGNIRKLKIPYWDDILLIASKIQLITNLGYLAADIVIDKNSGPVLLEINARAGLGVQIANLSPLRRRLERIKGLKVSTPQKGVRLAKDMFGEQIERNIKHLSGKQVIGSEEEVEIFVHGQSYKLRAAVDSMRVYSAIDSDFAKKIGLLSDQAVYNSSLERLRVKLKYLLRGVKIQTAIESVSLADRGYKMVLGTRDLTGFLIDPSYQPLCVSNPPVFGNTPALVRKSPVNFSQIDAQIVQIDRQIRLLYYLKPLNLAEEVAAFTADYSYNPQFSYPELKFSSSSVKSVLSSLRLDDSVLGQLYMRKIEELTKKLDLLEARGRSNFPQLSESLFGLPSKEDVFKVQSLVKEYVESVRLSDEKNLSSKQAAILFRSVFEKYGLSNWKIVFKDSMVSNVLTGKDSVLYINKKARFSQQRIKSLIVHEIETHILTAENGKRQPYGILSRGTGYYLKTQEGLAVYNQHAVLAEKTAIGVSVLAVDQARTVSFSKLYHFLRDIGLSHERALKLCLKVKRGSTDTSSPGAFSKEQIYYQGFNDVSFFVSAGGDLRRLYVGKVSLEDLPFIEKIHGLVVPEYLPDWLKK